MTGGRREALGIMCVAIVHCIDLRQTTAAAAA